MPGPRQGGDASHSLSRGSTKGRLDPPRGSLEPSQIRKQGWLEKQASRKLGRALQRRYCEAYKGAFVYYKSAGPERKHRAIITLTSWSTVVQDLIKGRVFYLTPSPAARVYQFVAETETECKEWVDVVRAGCVDEGMGHALSPQGDPFFKDEGPTIGVFVKAFLRCEEHQCVVVTTTLFPRSPVLDLMRIIRDTPSLAFPISEQSLMFDRIVLDPQHTLEYYGIKADDVIVVIHNTPIIHDATSVSEILAHLGSGKLSLPDPVVGCVAWSDRKQEHYHIYWAKGQWASRAQPTLSAEQKKEIRASGSKSIPAQAMGDVGGSPAMPSGSSRIYLPNKRDSLNLSPSPPHLSLSLSTTTPRSPSLISQSPLLSRSPPPPPLPSIVIGGTNPPSTTVFHAGAVIPASLSSSSSINSISISSANNSNHFNSNNNNNGGSSSSSGSCCGSSSMSLSLSSSSNYLPPPSPLRSSFSNPLFDQNHSPVFQTIALQGKFANFSDVPVPVRKRSTDSRRASDPTHQEVRPRVSTCTLPMPPQEGITWKRGKELGKGAWGTVYEALNIQSGALMAVKQVPIKLDDAEKQRQAKALEREIAMMTVLSHPNIVKIIGSEIKDDKINILMEYVPGASLSTQLKQFGPFSEEHAKRYARQLVEALAYCHAAGVVHRDIKGANVLVTLSGNPKLADFGSAKRLADVEQKESLSEDFNYTVEWTAPEVFSQGEFNSKVDIWSLGCVIVEMITAQIPWAEQKFNNREHAMFFIGSNAAIPAIPKKLSPQGQDFLLRCLQRDPVKRDSAKDLLQHPWISHLPVDLQFEGLSLDPPRMMAFSDRPRSYVPPPTEMVIPLIPIESEVGPLTNPTNPQSPT